ncbi:2-octaprenyl-3-methyl-6-methoxy-1,4-benzoquinol hydroxylase [Marinobacter persicus]|uniref:2-octaprenyl-3-methyl-6-methoxy-1,4-benzoquinol hydroxylase n=1 Tax=Marinobacter persicus TaxID=930118 RepID=A0A1I3QMF3_9GAMM|nr:FAD-dependent monooxygenase [Marinobacter persicus]GHD42621.1 2-octaprenyl-3-methyl-6-methoxy-1,4-benzoquinol hydroxylase [Marinobacter persicus]SFJ34712.1 2-octaprenyl-3-methyl-6-methoxy-1,4-benzoquinol hydroxylase [Marinobacter persicus]
MTQHFDIIITGGGMVGAALATGLGRQGHHVALIDLAEPAPFDPHSRPDIRVSALSAGSEDYLRSLGAWTAIPAMRATPYRRLGVWDAANHPITDRLPEDLNHVEFNADDLGTSHLGHIVENSVTRLALWQTAQQQDNVTLLTGQGISSLSQNDQMATIGLEDGTQLHARLVIGADGARSQLRELAGIGTHRDQYQQQAMVMSVRYRGEPQDITWQGFYPSGPRAFLPLHGAGEQHPGETWASLVWYDSPARHEELMAMDDRELMMELRHEFPASLPKLTHIDARACFPIARQHANQYYSGRVVLAGDAAHTINPLAGQGVNLGFQDAWCLQTLLEEARLNGTDPDRQSLLAQYEQQRRPANRRMMLTMDVFYHLFSNEIPPVHLLRNLGLGAARALPFARNRVARYAMGLEEPPAFNPAQLASRLPGFDSLFGQKS